MDVTEETRGGVLVLRVNEPRLDAARAPGLRDELIRRVEAGNTTLVLDLSQVEFMDSSGLGARVAGLKRLGSRGGLTIVGAHGAVQRLFQLTRMDKVFALHPTIDDAVAAMTG